MFIFYYNFTPEDLDYVLTKIFSRIYWITALDLDEILALATAAVDSILFLLENLEYLLPLLVIWLYELSTIMADHLQWLIDFIIELIRWLGG